MNRQTYVDCAMSELKVSQRIAKETDESVDTRRPIDSLWCGLWWVCGVTKKIDGKG